MSTKNGIVLVESLLSHVQDPRPRLSGPGVWWGVGLDPGARSAPAPERAARPPGEPRRRSCCAPNRSRPRMSGESIGGAGPGGAERAPQRQRTFVAWTSLSPILLGGEFRRMGEGDVQVGKVRSRSGALRAGVLTLRACPPPCPAKRSPCAALGPRTARTAQQNLGITPIPAAPKTACRRESA